jgi:hypothetical protein
MDNFEVAAVKGGRGCLKGQMNALGDVEAVER